jgi:GNAT superfamily N-acetyltransferase
MHEPSSKALVVGPASATVSPPAERGPLVSRSRFARCIISGMVVSVRRAVEADAEQVADLYLRARRAAVAFIPMTAHPEDDVRRWIAAHVIPRCEAWVASDEAGVVVGLLVLDRDWLDQLYVEPTLTARRIGAQLLEVAKRERPDGLRLWTFAANEGARRFYERHGFTARGCTSGDNEEGAPDVLYAWPAAERD